MRFIKIAILVIVGIIISSKLLTAQTIPIGFKLIVADIGVKVYTKNNIYGKSDYVTVINLNSGSISNLTGQSTNVPNGEIERKLITQFWQDAVKDNTISRKAKVVINGAFFSTKKNPTPIAFGLKVAGRIISYGYGLDEYPHLTSVFFFNTLTRTANIQPYKKEIFDSITTDVVGALAPTADKSSEKYLPRTFVGIRDEDGDNILETVLFYSSNSARQIDADNTLKEFGASATAMLDGGGSTALVINGKAYIGTNRKIPHAIAIYSGK